MSALATVILIAGFLLATWVSLAATETVTTSTTTTVQSDFWHKRYLRMKRYARGREKVGAVQLKEIHKLRALVPQPFWVPAWFRAQALCIHRHESIDWRNRGHHFGGLQFNLGTWASVGGRGNPADASPAEQIYRAYLVWKRDGGSWREWTTASICGLS